MYQSCVYSFVCLCISNNSFKRPKRMPRVKGNDTTQLRLQSGCCHKRLCSYAVKSASAPSSQDKRRSTISYRCRVFTRWKKNTCSREHSQTLQMGSQPIRYWALEETDSFPEKRQDGDFVNSCSGIRASSCLPHQDLGMLVVMNVYVSPKFICVDT